MKALLYIYLFCSFFSYSQGSVGYIFEELPSDSTSKRTIKTHTSLKPLIRQHAQIKGGKNLNFTPLGDLNLLQSSTTGLKLGLGLEFKGEFKDKLYFRLSGVEGISQNNLRYGRKTYLNDSIGAINLYSDIRSRISYSPNHIFNFQLGLDHNFIGEGARSMLLSDYGTSYPFGKIRMRFWRLEYAILYQFLRERDNNQWAGKFASSHHLSFNAAKWLNIGVFETVVFQPKDTLVNRGFDVEYLNPFVFYRPQEYSLGSSDNVLLGIQLNAFWKKHTFYSQFILDEFYFAEIKAKSGWWANKFGGQFGVKGRFSKTKNKLFYRLEYNFARPYTYSHISKELNYGNQGNPLSHPYGSNFMEILAEAKWQKQKISAKLFCNYYLRSNDKDGFNYGNDIYQPYINRPFEYGHTIGQGQGFNGTKVILTGGYELIKGVNLNAFIENHVDYNTISNSVNYTAVIGLRSQLWNDYRNY
ncbi:MAG: hypothetical protein MK105_02170 [Crocinitomicaceae bacterium]|nr:hypothetical protein [Crocinitomicaceae bacterium]